jgi:hypothetical protein
MMRKI